MYQPAAPVTPSIRFDPLSDEHALQILDWQYPGSYSFYTISTDHPEDVLVEMLDGTHYEGIDDVGEFIGFWAVGYAAQLPGGHDSGAYDRHPGLDIGLGLRPDLMGQGHGLGRAFVESGLQLMRERYGNPVVRLSVATFNQRAIRVYEQTGFVARETYCSDSSSGPADFLLMTREPSTILR